MSGYPGQTPINPTPTQPGYYGPPPGQAGYPGYPAPNQGPYQIGFNPYTNQPGQPAPGNPPPSAMSYPVPPQPSAPQPSAPGYGYPGVPSVTPQQPGYPNVTPQHMGYPNVTPQQPGYPIVTPQALTSVVEWIHTNPTGAVALVDKAVVAGYEGHDGSPLWVIRARYEGDLIPGKLAIKHRVAYVAWGGRENSVQNIEVLCARPERVRWVESRDGAVPPNAITAGNTSSGEPLFVGRAKQQGSLTPGKVHPSHKVLYISFAGNEVPHRVYEVLCTVADFNICFFVYKRNYIYFSKVKNAKYIISSPGYMEHQSEERQYKNRTGYCIFAVVQWIHANPTAAASLVGSAVVAGHEAYDKSALWVIRAWHEGDLIPGKLAIKHHKAYIPWWGKEHIVQDIEVLCARPEKVRWVQSGNGALVANAVVAGKTSAGEPLFVGRAKHKGSLTPGKVHSTHNVLYISFAGCEIAYREYEILCTV
ncbi:uncharacterized protein LOC131851940 [Achroia grisella]|uniref:uncharacterized protein LOC131851940 n=1 Tax=Achroia grisella TaxID=688607 RepID=UPI0027D2F41A|nr:uncharacterized protein LOC131851940 [Achroia grisella]